MLCIVGLHLFSVFYAAIYVYIVLTLATFMHLKMHFLSGFPYRDIISVELLPDRRRHYEERGVG